jgi:hypothetical protein
MKIAQGNLNKKISYEENIDEFASHKAKKNNFQCLKSTPIITFKY